MHRLTKLLREIHRRSVWQVLAVYLAGSWGVLQAVDWVTGFVGLPEWTPGFALVLLLIGLPIVGVTAIIQEGPPALTGEYRDEVDPNELVGRTPAEVHVDPPAHPLSPERLFTWRNAILGGVCAAALFVGSVVAYLAMWATGIGPVGSLVAQGVLHERDPIILADFEDRTDDPSLAAAVTDAFRVELAESRVVTLMDGRLIQDVLQETGRAPDARLDPAAAREIAARVGAKAVVEGDLSRVGTGYLLAARIVVPADGHALAAFRETAVDDADLLPALDRLSRRVREKAGESLRDVRAGPPLEAVTTSSLDALRKLAEANRADEAGEVDKAIDLLKEAVALDPGFAMAWLKLAAVYGNQGGDEAATVEAATRAFESRNRLTERERQLAIALYNDVVVGDVEEVVRAYRRLLDDHPDDPVALNNLAASYMTLERWSDAVAILERAVSGPARSRSAYADLVLGLYNVGRKDGAFGALDRWQERYPPDFSYFRTRAIVLLGTGDPDGAQATLDEGVAALDADVVGRLGLIELGGRLAEARGRLGDAERRFREGLAISDAQGIGAGSVFFTLDIALVHIAGGADARAELRSVDREAERRFEELPPLDRPYHELGLRWAEYGRDADRAEAWWGRLRDATPDAVRERPSFVEEELLRRQWLALLRGRPADALQDLRELRLRRRCGLCDLRETAAAFAALQEPDSAIASLERWLAGDAFDSVVDHATRRGGVLAMLARLYEEVGRLDDARATWLRFADGWVDADEVLQPRVRAARERAAALADRLDTARGSAS
jgi:tetratricopeptide (TPR) repeat protein